MNTCLLQDEDGDFADWVELYNKGSEPVNLKGWYLSDDRLELNKWMFSTERILEPGEHVLIFLSGKDKRTGRNGAAFHTNFSLKANSETLYLSNVHRVIMDSLEGHAPEINSSFGRSADGMHAWKYFYLPTPGQSNDTILPAPVLSLKSGFYTTETVLTVLAESIPEGCELRYTINDGITIIDDQAVNRDEWLYPANSSGTLYSKGIQLSETAIVKARYYKGDSAGPLASYTYFINESFEIPVISLVTDPADLWDPERGIYVTGNDPEKPNYLEDDWEIPARFTYFTDGSSSEPAIDIDCSVRIFGSATRSFPNKSLAVFSRDRQMPNLFFRNNSDSVYSLLLRAGASDFPRAIMRDIITSELVRPLDLDAQDYQQAILFINGQFWSITNIREKVNEEMIEDTHLIDPDALDLMFATYSFDPRNGTSDAYQEMYEYITQSNLFITRNYNKVENYLDIENFIDYIIIETFINNGDWPANNVKAWKSWENDSLWKWIVYDTDASYDTEEFWSRNNPYENNVIGVPSFNAIQRLLTSTSGNHITSIFNSIMRSPRFKEQFISRYEELVGARDGQIIEPEALLGTDRLLGIVSNLAGNIESYMQRQIDRWLPEYPSYMISGEIPFDDTTINRWYHQIDVIKDFISVRPSYVAGFLEQLETDFVPTGKDLITNGSFDSGDTDWNLRWSEKMTDQSIESIDGNAVGKIVIHDDHIQTDDPASIVAFVYDSINLEQARVYSLSFSIRSDVQMDDRERALVYLFRPIPPYTRYTDIYITPSEDWQKIEMQFTLTSESDPDARLQFRLGLLPPGTVLYIDDVSIKEMEVTQ